MWIYIFPVFLCFISFYFEQTRNNKIWWFLIISYLCLYLCWGYMCGSDWRSYEFMYNKIDFNNLFYDYWSEPGYYIYMLIFKVLDIDFWHFFIFTKIICFGILIKTINDYAQNYRYIVLMYFIPWYANYLFIDNPMRNLIAISFFVIASKYIIERKIYKYMLILVVALSFHISALLMIPMYFILTKNIKTVVYIFLFIVVNFIFADRTIIVYVISNIFSVIPIVAFKLEAYISNDSEYAVGRILSFGMIFHTVFFVLILCNRARIEELRRGTFLLNSAIFYLLLYRLGTTIEIFMRFQLYLCAYFSCVIVYLISLFESRSKYIYISYLLVLSLMVCISKVRDVRYIPYSNYLEYVIKGYLPDFDYRDSYNEKNSPYEKTE